MRISMHIDIPDEVLEQNGVNPEQVLAEFQALKAELAEESPKHYKFSLEVTKTPGV